MLPGKGIGLIKTQPWFSCKGRDVPGDVRHRLGDPNQLSILARAASLPSRLGPCGIPGCAPAPPRAQHHGCGTSTRRGTGSGTCRERAEAACRDTGAL